MGRTMKAGTAIFVFVALLGSLFIAAPGGAQSGPSVSGCAADCVHVIESMLQWLSAEHGIPLSAIVVDTAASGYDAGFRAGIGRERPVPAAALHQSLSRMGVTMSTATDSWDCPRNGEACRVTNGSAFFAFIAPRISQDSATINVRQFIPSAGSGYRGLIWYARLSKQRGAWHVVSAETIGKS
jgi:hypothetical protein